MTNRNCLDCFADCERAGYDGRPREEDCFEGEVEEVTATVACVDTVARKEIVQLWNAVALMYAAIFPEAEPFADDAPAPVETDMP